MAIPTGISAQLGLVAEVTYGTFVVPTRFLEFTDESLKLNIERIESKGIRAARRVLRSTHRILNRKSASGNLEFEVAGKGFGIIFDAMLGANSSSASGTGKKWSFILGDTAAKSLTIQAGRPANTGTVQPFSYTGCKVTDWEMSCEVDGLLMLKVGIDGQDETTAQALATASYPADAAILNFTGASCTVNAVAVPLTKFSVKGDNKLNTKRHFLQASPLHSTQLTSDLVDIQGNLTFEFTDLTRYGLFTAGTIVPIVLTFTAGATEIYDTALPYKVVVTMAACQFDGETPNVGGSLDVVEQGMPFTVLDDGTNPPIQIDYYTGDTVI